MLLLASLALLLFCFFLIFFFPPASCSNSQLKFRNPICHVTSFCSYICRLPLPFVFCVAPFCPLFPSPPLHLFLQLSRVTLGVFLSIFEYQKPRLTHLLLCAMEWNCASVRHVWLQSFLVDLSFNAHGTALSKKPFLSILKTIVKKGQSQIFHRLSGFQFSS